LFLTNKDDLRGTAPRNPQGFAKLALAQPEFAKCMTSRVLGDVFGNATDPAVTDLEPRLRQVVDKRGTFRELMKIALVRYVTIELERRTASGGPGAASSQATLVELANKRCTECHEADDGTAVGKVLAAGDGWCKTPDAACRHDSIEMISLVSFGAMPKARPFAVAETKRFVELLAPIAYPTQSERALAMRYFLGDSARPVHDLRGILRRLQAKALPNKPATNRPMPAWGASPRSVSGQAVMGLTAARSCEAADNPAECVKQVLADPAMIER
jgi:hypothetical protein